MYPQRSVMTCGLATALEPPHFNHAPVWGATKCSSFSLSSFYRFNPRTRVGCDRLGPLGRGAAARFQSTHPRGVRRRDLPAYLCGRAVSIHAPAWGATVPDARRRVRVVGFNPRTRVGCDRRLRSLSAMPGWFQSTHPRGVRKHFSYMASRTFVQFQSTHPRGVRPARPPRTWCRCAVSIHAPAWGATPRPSCLSMRPRCFNPRTRVGCDRSRRPASGPGRRFQSTHPRGVRPQATLAVGHAGVVSIHAPAWGAKAFFIHGKPDICAVSIHAPAWGATLLAHAGVS